MLLRRAEVAWTKHGLANTDILFGHAKARLDKVRRRMAEWQRPHSLHTHMHILTVHMHMHMHMPC